MAVEKVEKATREEFHPFPYQRPMKKLLFLALLSSISVVTKSWLVLDNPPTIDDVVDGTIQEVQQSPVPKESQLWEQIPSMEMWGPDSTYSRVPGKRFATSTMTSSLNPDLIYRKVASKRFAPLLMGTWRPDSVFSRIPGKREMNKKWVGPSWELGRTVFLPWTIHKSGSLVYNTKVKKEAKEGDKEEVEELGQGGLKALLPWGMNLQSPMLRGKKAHLPFELDANE